MVKMVKGNHPKEHEGYELVTDLGEWSLYRRDQGKGNGWATYRVVANGRAERKGNYWMAINEQTGQMGFARDAQIMMEKRRALYELVMTVITGE